MMSRRGAGFRARLAALGCLAVAAALAAGSCADRRASCDVCGRDECSALAFRVEYADGGRQVTCCPRCASHAVAESGGRRVTQLMARDFATGREIDARSATFVDGSDVEHCRAPKEERTEPGCCRVLMYDRCLPSLIAFASSADATRFAGEHGGAIRVFQDLAFGRR